MVDTSNSYSLLISKLDQFIRKYYLNQILRGSLYLVGLVLGMFLLFNVLEYFFYFPKGGRKAIFISFIFISVVSLFYWVIRPMLAYFKLGNSLTYEQAAEIVGEHFSDVQDKLLNILQLKKQGDVEQNELIEASINQKSSQLKLVPFKNAVDLSHNKKYLKYALPPFLLFLVLLFAAPSIIKDSTYRIINNNEEFEREAPFHLILEDENHQVVQYDDYTMTVTVEGEVLPENVYIDVNNYSYKLKKVSSNSFEYTFKNVIKDTPFRIYSGSVEGPKGNLKVLLRPELVDFKLYLNYPNYTGVNDEVLQNVGDISVPVGTMAEWKFEGNHTDGMSFNYDGAILPLEKSEGIYTLSKKLMKATPYTLYLQNEMIPVPDSFLYSIQVIPDQYPSISVEKFMDTLDQSLMFFLGNASDDYEIGKVTFNYTISNSTTDKRVSEVKVLDIADGRMTKFDYTIDAEKLALEPGDKLSYYFEVFDNDGIQGSKSTKTAVMTFSKPSLEELKDDVDKTSEEIQKDLDEATKEIKKIKEDFKKLRDKLRDKKEIDWQTRKELEKLLERQKKAMEKMDKARENFKENREKEESLEKSESIQQKEERLEELFEETKKSEMEELMEKIRELMEELNKDETQEMMEQMEQDDKTLEKELDRLKELYKELELEKDVEDFVNEMNELAKEQEKLSRETEQSKKPQEQLQKEQEEIEEKLEEMKEELKELEKKNEELEKPKDLGEKNESQMEDINDDIDSAQEEIEKQENQGASESQKKASEKMKKMAAAMQSSMSSSSSDQLSEDIKMIRQLLENLLTLSFEQEDLIGEFSSTNQHTPRFVELVQDQFKIKNDFTVVEDTLEALAKRQPKIETFVLEKMTEIHENLEDGIGQLEERQKKLAEENQRRTMKGLNDLALMLDESMQEMQEDMANQSQGSGSCSKPGGKGQGKAGKEPTDKITKGQEGVKKSLQEMLEKMKNGDGKPKPGEGGKNGKDGMAKEFAEAAARQAALRKAVEKMKQENTEQGKGDGGLQEIIDQMDQIETDLVNRRLDASMINRQNKILTRLLEVEKAEKQRGMDEKRKAAQAQQTVRKFPPDLEEYIKQRESEIQQIKSVSPALKPHYKMLVEKYYNSLKTSGAR